MPHNNIPSESCSETARASEYPRFDPGAELRCAWRGSILDRFRNHVARQPDAVCTGSAEEQITYEELHATSDRLAELIIGQAPVPGGVLSVYAARNPRLTIALLAAIKAGFAFHIIDPKYPLRRIVDCLNYVRPKGILNASEDCDGAEQVAGLLQPGGAFCCLNIAGRLERESAADDRDAAPVLEGSPINANSPMYVTFTSGTTGLPKAVWGSHGPVSHFFEWQHRRFEIGTSDRVSVLSGLAHDPLLRDVLMPVWAGCSSWFPSDDVFKFPGLLYAWLRDTKITVIHLTPSLCHLLHNIPKSEPSPCLPHVRLAFFGGEVLTFKLARRFRSLAPNAQIVNCYGATETPQVMAFHIVESPAFKESLPGAKEDPAVPIGRGIEGVQLLLLDDDNRLCGEGVTGEICIRTPHRAVRVEDIAGRPAGCFVANPFSSDADDLLYRMGDYGQYLLDGTVVFLGRRDRQVKVRGFRVDLCEIERALQECRGVAQFHLDAVAQGEDFYLALFVAPEAGVAIQPELLRSELTRRLPAFMVPDRIMILESLPQTPNGKVDRHRLREMLDSGPASRSSVSAPGVDRGEEPAPAMILQRLRSLQLPVMDRDETIGPLDSLRMVEVSCMLENEFGVRLSIGELQRCQSLPVLAGQIVRQLEGQTKEKIQQPAGRSPASGAPAADPGAVRASLTGGRPKGLGWLPPNERVWRAFANRILQLLARVAPDALRVRLHRWRRVQVGLDVSIGYDTIIETAFPWLVRIGDHTNIGMRVTVIGHFRGMELAAIDGPTVIIDDYSFVGPGVIILPNVTIGKGAVVAAGSVVTASIPPYCFAQGNPARVVARCGVALSGPTSYAEFLDQLVPLSPGDGHATGEAVGDLDPGSL